MAHWLMPNASQNRLFTRRAQAFWNERQKRAGAGGPSGYLLDESPPCIGRHRFEGEWAELMAVLKRSSVERGSCLDVGCGSGLWLQALAGEFGRAEGWDYAPAMAKAARARLKQAGVANASVHTGSAAARQGKALFDFIFVGGVLMYAPDRELRVLLAALKRLLKPQGLLLLRESVIGGETWLREGLALRPGLLAGAGKRPADYVAIYRSPETLRAGLRAAGLEALRDWPNRHYKLSDLTEDWLRRLDRLSGGRLGKSPQLAGLAAEGLFRARHLILYPEYFFRKWKLQNRWFLCAQAPRRSST